MRPAHWKLLVGLILLAELAACETTADGRKTYVGPGSKEMPLGVAISAFGLTGALTFGAGSVITNTRPTPAPTPEPASK